MFKNDNIVPRRLSPEEKKNMAKGDYDSFANYLSFCPGCGYIDKSNMYLLRAEERVRSLHEKGTECPGCGKCEWELGYPAATTTGFVDFE